MKKITVSQIMALHPCSEYTQKQVTELWAGRKSITPLELLDLSIPVTDRIWAACRVVPKPAIKCWLDIVVTRAVTNNALHCGVPAVEIWAQKWLSGEDRTETAAWVRAAGVAAREAWVAAAESAAAAAEARAAESAAWAGEAWARAAGEAEEEAAWVAAAAEREQQIEDLKQLLEENRK